MVNNIIQELSESQFHEFINKEVVIVDFFAEWCMPCLILSPIIEEMAEKFKGKIDFARLNIDDHPCVADKFNVSGVPTLVFFKEGKIIERVSGNVSPHILEEKFEKFIEKLVA